MTPTARSLKHLRGEGWLAEVVERFIPGANIRKDLFGIGDVVAIKYGGPPNLIQVTSGSNVASRVKKIQESEHLPVLLACGWLVQVHGWRKNAKGRWTLRVVDIVPPATC